MLNPKYKQQAEEKAKNVVDSMINGRYIKAEDYSLHPKRTFKTICTTKTNQAE